MDPDFVEHWTDAELEQAAKNFYKKVYDLIYDLPKPIVDRYEEELVGIEDTCQSIEYHFSRDE